MLLLPPSLVLCSRGSRCQVVSSFPHIPVTINNKHT